MPDADSEGDAWAKPEPTGPGARFRAIVALVFSVTSLCAALTTSTVILWLLSGVRGGSVVSVVYGVLAILTALSIWITIAAVRKCSRLGVRKATIVATTAVTLAVSTLVVLAASGVL